MVKSSLLMASIKKAIGHGSNEIYPIENNLYVFHEYTVAGEK